MAEKNAPATVAEAIRSIPLLSGLKRENLARIAGRLEETVLTAGETVVTQGERGDVLFVVHKGAVEVILEDEGHEVSIVAVLGPNECFGEMALFTGDKRSASVRALVDSVLFKLDRAAFDDLLKENPSLVVHFCRLLSTRLSETDRSLLMGQASLKLGLEEFFSTLPEEMQSFLVETSVLTDLDGGAIQETLSFAGGRKLLEDFSTSHPYFIHRGPSGVLRYRRYFQEFLEAKVARRESEMRELHQRAASYFSRQGNWPLAVEHYIKAGAWKEAVGVLERRADDLLDHEQRLIEWIDALPEEIIQGRSSLIRLRALAYSRLGNLGAAIRDYRKAIAHDRTLGPDTVEAASHYLDLARLHQRKGENEEALGCLTLGVRAIEGEKRLTNALQAIQAVEGLQRDKGLQQEAFRWGERGIRVAQKLVPRWASGSLNATVLGPLVTLAIAGWIWILPPFEGLDRNGMHFIATVVGAVGLWILGALDDYVVAVGLLLAWLLLGIVSAEMALAGFSKSSWFFVLGVLGLGAAVSRTGLLYRVSLRVLRHVPAHHKVYTAMFGVSGLVATPLLPTAKARLAIIVPLCQEISQVIGFEPRSNGSASLSLSAFTGFSVMSFMFLTGGTYCLIGWNLLAEPSRATFSWGDWMLAALPAGVVTLGLLLVAVWFFFPVPSKEFSRISRETVETQLEILGPLTVKEWLSLTVLIFAVAGFLGKPLHGISEAWVALSALFLFLLTGVLGKTELRSSIDWGSLIFLGVLSSLAGIMLSMNVDQWLLGYVGPFLSHVSFNATSFLLAVAVLVYSVRFFLKKIPTVILMTLTLVPLAESMNIHAGVVLLTIVIAIESWFLPYQADSYQVAYYGTDGQAFSHGQARKLMVVKLVISLLAIAISVPYWEYLGLIR